MPTIIPFNNVCLLAQQFICLLGHPIHKKRTIINT